MARAVVIIQGRNAAYCGFLKTEQKTSLENVNSARYGAASRG
jgi:hypothetical protein